HLAGAREARAVHERCETDALLDHRGASPLGLPYTRTRGGPVPRSVRVAHSLRSFARDWGRVLTREALAFCVIVRQLERAIEETPHVPRLRDRLADGERLSGDDEVPAAEVFRREPDGRRDLVHVALEREEALRRAEASKGAVRRHVGRDRA